MWLLKMGGVLWRFVTLYAFSAAIGGVSLRGESLGVVQAYFPWLFPCHLILQTYMAIDPSSPYLTF